MTANPVHGGLDLFVVLRSLAENAFVVGRHDFDELGRNFGPLGEDFFGDHRSGVFAMLLDQVKQIGAIISGRELLQLDDAQIAAADEIAHRVPHISNAAAHTGGKVAAGRTKDDDAAAGHVFAAVVADAFDYGVGSAVADRK